jgi:hypothetical protein
MHVLLRRQPGPDSTFVSVVETVVDEPALSAIDLLECSDPAVVGVRVQRPGGTDYVFVGDEGSAEAEVTCAALPGLRFTGRQAVITLVDGEVSFAQLVDGVSLVIGDVSVSCAGPMRGSITAFDDDADTFTVDASLPEGDALRGAQLLVSGRTDGAYEIGSVEAREAGALVHLADAPIMRVEAGDPFMVPSVAEVRRLGDGTLTRRE